MDLSFIPILMLAAFVHGALGFGFPLVSTPLLVFMMDMRTAIQLTLIPTIVVNLVSILGEKHWREAVKTYWLIPVFTMVGSISGTQLLLSVNPEPFRLLLALMLLGYLFTERLKPVSKSEQWHLPRWFMMAFGFLLGFLAGVVNVFSPLIVVFALYFRVKPELLVAMFNIAFVTSKTGQLSGFLVNDALSLEILKYALLSLPFLLLSLWLGMKLRKRLTSDAYVKLLRLSLWVMSAGLIADWAVKSFA